MSYKLGFLAGAAAGYVLGARAGRGQYEQIKKQSLKAWNSDPVQNKVADAATAVKAKTPELTHGLVDKAVSAVQSDDRTAPTVTGTTGSVSDPKGPAIS